MCFEIQVFLFVVCADFRNCLLGIVVWCIEIGMGMVTFCQHNIPSACIWEMVSKEVHCASVENVGDKSFVSSRHHSQCGDVCYAQLNLRVSCTVHMAYWRGPTCITWGEGSSFLQLSLFLSAGENKRRPNKFSAKSPAPR